MRINRAWQRMLSGRRLEILDPSPLDIEIEDIAHGLSFLARWNGQTVGDYPFSVAQHSLLVENIFSMQFPDMDNPSVVYIRFCRICDRRYDLTSKIPLGCKL